MNPQIKVFGLIGNPLNHSLSKIYFEEKFINSAITDCEYKLFQLNSINELPYLLKSEPNLQGFNVTHPFKQQILQYADECSPLVKRISSTNCIKIKNNKLIAYNTDAFGFEKSLKKETDITKIHSALILGTGGAANAVADVLIQHGIKIQCATRKLNPQSATKTSYENLSESDNLEMFDLIVNTTPCGMDGIPPLKNFPYHLISFKHTVFDLIYNPKETLLLFEARKQGAKTINGLKMLHYQADGSWNIWTKDTVL